MNEQARLDAAIAALLLAIAPNLFAAPTGPDATASVARGVVSNPTRCDARPEYPTAAARRNVQGRTTIELTFAAGSTEATGRVVASSGPLPENVLLDQAALSAMSHCRLAYAEPAADVRRIEYVWKLEDGTDADLEAFRQKGMAADRLRVLADAKLSVDAEHGVAVAQLELAKRYANGGGRDRDDKLASNWFRRAAEAGNPDAQVYFGQRLMVGKGVSQDDEAGIAWLRKAAAQGSGTAAYGLGIFTRAGRGMPASDAEAFRWFLQGAQAGTIAAMLETADAYAKGTGTPRDDAQAARWNLAAAPMSNAAIYRLGLAYRDGLGVPVDYERAAFCMAVTGRHGERSPTAALATIAPHLEAATMVRIQAQADGWQPGEPLFK